MNLNYKKEWTEQERLRVVQLFSEWERDHLIITYGRRARNAEFTYGLPYTSSSSYALLGCTNVEAKLKADRKYTFNHLALNEYGVLFAVFYDKDEGEKHIRIKHIWEE